MPIALGEAAHGLAQPSPAPPPTISDDWARYKSTGSVASRNRLVAHYMSTHVRPIATRLHAGLPHQVDLEDLVQQGYLGLIDAMDRYKLNRETRFETYSRRRILGAIQDYLRSLDTVPRLTRTRAKRFSAARERFQKEYGRAPSADELRPLLDLPEPVFVRVVTEGVPAAVVPFSHVLPDGAGDDGHEADAMSSFEDPAPTGPVRQAEMRDLQHWIVRGFAPRDRLIIILYYYEKLTMAEVGNVVGISESRVSQRLESILECLRARLLATGAEQEFVFG